MENTVTLSIKELETLIKEKKQEQAQLQEEEKKVYEQEKDKTIASIFEKVGYLSETLASFKTDCHDMMEHQATKLEEYGKLRSNSKGGFSITNTDGSLKITRRRDTEPVWDERSNKAMQLIKDFLGDAIKKRDIKMYEILMSFLERNSNGDLEYNRVMELYKHEDKFDDERWKEGLRLIKESFSKTLKGFGYEFKYKDTNGKWQNASLNFSSL